MSLFLSNKRSRGRKASQQKHWNQRIFHALAWKLIKTVDHFPSCAVLIGCSYWMTAHWQKQALPACCSYSTPVPADAVSSGRAVRADTVLCFCGVSLLSPSVPAGFSPSQGWVSASCESERLIQSFVFSRTMSLSCLTHCLALLQISDPLIDNHTFVLCYLGKFQSLYPPPPLHCSALHHVQTRSQRSDLVMARCENRLPVGWGMLRYIWVVYFCGNCWCIWLH